MRKTMSFVVLVSFLLASQISVFAAEVAPRITDREIVERLARLEEGQRALHKRIDDLRSEMNGRFDTLQWILGFFITISLVILGFVLRLQWQMARRQTHMEATLDTHKDELAFLKGLIEKLLPPRGTQPPPRPPFNPPQAPP